MNVLISVSSQMLPKVRNTDFSAQRSRVRGFNNAKPQAWLPAVAGSQPRPGGGKDAEMQVIPVPMPLLTALSSMRVTVPPDLRGADARQAMLLMLRVRRALALGFEHSLRIALPEQCGLSASDSHACFSCLLFSCAC